MEIKVVSIVAEPVAPMYRDVSGALERALKSALSDLDFGGDVAEFVIAIVAVEEDPAANLRFCVPNNKVGRYKHWQTHETVKFISIALPFDPIRAEALSASEVFRHCCDALSSRMGRLQPKTPRGFDHALFSLTLRETLVSVSGTEWLVACNSYTVSGKLQKSWGPPRR